MTHIRNLKIYPDKQQFLNSRFLSYKQTSIFAIKLHQIMLQINCKRYSKPISNNWIVLNLYCHPIWYFPLTSIRHTYLGPQSTKTIWRPLLETAWSKFSIKNVRVSKCYLLLLEIDGPWHNGTTQKTRTKIQSNWLDFLLGAFLKPRKTTSSANSRKYRLKFQNISEFRTF